VSVDYHWENPARAQRTKRPNCPRTDVSVSIVSCTEYETYRDRLCPSVRLSVPTVFTVAFQPFDLSPSSFAYMGQKKEKGSPYSLTEHRVSELIPVLSSQHAGDVSHEPDGRLPLLSARPAVTPQPLRGLLPISLRCEQRHNGCEQFA